MSFKIADAFVDVTSKDSTKEGLSKIDTQMKSSMTKSGSDAGDSAGKASGGRFASAMKSPLVAIGGVMAGAFAVDKVVGFFKDSIAESRESQKVNAQTAAVIKSTGGAAKVTQGQFGDLATEISNKTAIDDEQIQAGENMLATFTNVRNEVGKGNDIFSQATKVSTDLAVATGVGQVKANVMLGKALNDPVKGMTALQKVGVTFSAGQKASIKTMMEHNNIAGAQKIILGELSKEFGGSAAAQATAGEKASVSWKNLQEQIGNGFMPIIDKVANFISGSLVPAISHFVTEMTNGTGAGGAFINFFKGVWNAIQPIGAFIMSIVVPAIKTLFSSFQSNGGPAGVTSAFGGMVSFFQGQVVPAIMNIVTAIRGFISVALPIVQEFVAGMRARIEPMLPTITAIFSTIGAIIVAAMELIRAVIEQVTTVIKFVWENWGNSIMSFISSIWSAILTVITAALNIIQGVIKTVTSIITGDWSGAWDGIKMILSGVWDAITSIINLALTYIGGILSAAWALITLAVSTVWNGIKSVLVGVWDSIKSALSSALDGYKAALSAAWDAIKSVVTAVWNAIKTVISGVWDAIKSVISGAINSVKSTVSSVTDAIKSAWTTVWNAIKSTVSSVWDGIKSVVSGAIGAVQSAIGGLSSIPGKVSGWFNSAKDGISSALNSAVSFVSGIPNRIIGALGNVGSMLYNAGASIIQGLINGITGMVGNVTNAISNVLSAARNLLPFSPAKEGPFSGKGWTTYSGASIVQGLAKGIEDNADSVGDATAHVAGIASRGLSGLSGPSRALSGGGSSLPGASGAPLGSSGTTYTGDILVTIPVKDLKEFKTVQDFFASIQQQARKGAGVQVARA